MSSATSTALTRLKSGLRIGSERLSHVASVSIGVWVPVGSRHERPAEAGAAHFLEHLLFKGTSRRTARDIAAAFDRVGGEVNAFTTKEYTAFYARVLSRDLDLALDVLCDILTEPAFRPEEIDAERQVILEEIAMNADEPSDVAHEAFSAAMFPDHELGREILGSEETVEAMDRDAIADFFGGTYSLGHSVLAAAGDIDHDDLVARVEKRWGSELPKPHRGIVATAAPVATPTRRVVVDRPTEQAHIVMGARGITVADDDRYALGLLDTILGGGMSSRLWQSIREDRGLAYSVYSYRSAYSDAGVVGVYAGTSPSRAEQVAGLMADEISRAMETEPSADELAIAKGHIRGSVQLALEDPTSRMSRIGKQLLQFNDVMAIDDMLERSDAVSEAEVTQVAQRVFGGERSLVVVGPEASVGGVDW